MGLTSVVAKPITAENRTMIEREGVSHYTRPENLAAIRMGTVPGSNLEQIKLTPPVGWGLNPFRSIRDMSIWDKDVFGSDYSRCTYFFVGTPGLAETRFLELQGIISSIQITGVDLIKYCQGPIFFRPVDNAIIVKGSYIGPAIVMSGDDF